MLNNHIHTPLVHPLAHCPKVPISFLRSPQTSDISSSKLMHLRECVTYFSEENKYVTKGDCSPPSPLSVSQHLGPCIPPSLLSLQVNSPTHHPHFHGGNSSLPHTHQDSLLQISPLTLTPIITSLSGHSAQYSNLLLFPQT